MRSKEDDIQYESDILYVLRVKNKYEIRIKAGTHTVMIGSGSRKESVIRCAKRLELYPEKLKKFSGIL